MKNNHFYRAILVISFLHAGCPTVFATKHIPGDTSIGTWDPINRVFTLTTDLDEGIEITEDNLILDGGGHTLAGPYPYAGSGVHLSGRKEVTVRDLNIVGFDYGILLRDSSENTILANNMGEVGGYGIHLDGCSNNTLISNTTFNSGIGIYLGNSNRNTLKENMSLPDAQQANGIRLDHGSSENTLTGNIVPLRDCFEAIWVGEGCNNNTLTGNTASWAMVRGIRLFRCSGNVVRRNTCSNGSTVGIELVFATGNFVTENTVDSNFYCGINLEFCMDNLLTGNTVTSTGGCGIAFSDAHRNTVSGNTVASNGWAPPIMPHGPYGIYLGMPEGGEVPSSNNLIYNNNFIDNQMQACDNGGTGNVFNLPKPIGGNYWSDWTAPDTDGDGIVDAPYMFTGGQDNLPWADPDGWRCEDVTDLIVENKSRMRYNRRTKEQTFYMSLTNISADPIDEPVVLVVEDISPLGLGALQNEDGTTLGGKPYFDVDVGPDGVLDPSESAAAILWQVSNPTRARWSFSILVCSGCRGPSIP